LAPDYKWHTVHVRGVCTAAFGFGGFKRWLLFVVPVIFLPMKTIGVAPVPAL
jgi:hypothetical protein